MNTVRPVRLSLDRLDPEERYILKRISLHDAHTRERLIAQSEWGKSKTDAIVRRLSDKGVLEVGEAKSEAKGRAPYRYSVRREFGAVIGIELNPSGDRFVLADFNGTILAKEELENSIDKPDVLASLDRNLTAFLATCGTPISGIGAMCIGVHGLSDEEKGIVRRFLHHDEEVELSFGGYFDRKYDLTVYIGRPKHLICLQEYRDSYIARKKTFVNANIGFGVGLSIFIEGKYYSGFSGLSGEFGHVIVPGHRKPCYCGNHGCLRTIASYKGICSEALARLDRLDEEGVMSRLDRDLLGSSNYEIGVEHIVDSALQHEKLSMNLLHDVGRHVGETLATVISVLNPELLTIHTNLVRAGECFTSPLGMAIRRNTLSLSLNDLKIEYSSWAPHAVAEGAAILALTHLLNLDGRSGHGAN